MPVAFAEQRLPLGTVHAVLAARATVDAGAAFAVANADDVYGESSMRLLADHLAGHEPEHVLVGYRLDATIATGDPVTRGICAVDRGGHLVGLSERRQVTRRDDGTYTARDGAEPEVLDAGTPASVNLWGFRPAIWDVLDAAMAGSGLDEEAMLAETAAGADPPKAEVLLPEMVATMVTEGTGLPVRVVTTDARLVGVTHAADTPVVGDELARQVACGVRSATLWSSAG